MPEQILVQFSIDKKKLPESSISRADAWHAFEELRKQAANVPEMSLDEINAEISAARDERRQRIFSAPHLTMLRENSPASIGGGMNRAFLLTIGKYVAKIQSVEMDWSYVLC